MKQNVFDINYEIHYPPNTRGIAELSRPGQLPIVEFYKVKVKSNFFYKLDGSMWFIRELTFNDEPLDAVLPSDWRTMKYRGFNTISDVKDWLAGY